MNLHASIASRPWSSFKGTPKLHIRYFEATLHVGITFKVALSPQVNLKSPMGYFEMNLNMVIAFRVRASYNFAISTDVLTFTNLYTPLLAYYFEIN